MYYNYTATSVVNCTKRYKADGLRKTINRHNINRSEMYHGNLYWFFIAKIKPKLLRLLNHDSYNIVKSIMNKVYKMDCSQKIQQNKSR